MRAGLLGLGLVGLLAGCSSSGDGDPDGGGPVACGAGSAEALTACVDRTGYVEDLTFVAAERPPGSEHHAAVRGRCAERFEALGYQVELHEYGSGTNVIGVKTGASLPDERVLVAAHYDHIDGCPGADDNGSGVAGLLEVARVLAQAEFDRTLVMACWDQEEWGLIGSAAYAQRAHDRGEQIVANYTFEMIGVKKTEPDSQQLPVGIDLLFPDEYAQLEDNEFRGDFIALVYDTAHSQQSVDDFVVAAGDVNLSAIGLGLSDALKNSDLVADLRRSDHAPFWMADLPGIMITDTSEFRYPQYHCRDGDDVIENLDHDFSVQVLQATVGSAARAAGLR